MAFPVETRTIDPRPALGLIHKGPYTEIGGTFDRLFGTLAKEGKSQHVRGCLGIYIDDPTVIDQEDLRSHACVYVDEGVTCEGLETMKVGGGEYAVLLYKGPYTAMQPAYDWFYGTWLPNSSREARDAPCLEINLNTPDTTRPADLLTEICLPLQ